jgi:hypothetical protein
MGSTRLSRGKDPALPRVLPHRPVLHTHTLANQNSAPSRGKLPPITYLRQRLSEVKSVICLCHRFGYTPSSTEENGHAVFVCGRRSVSLRIHNRSIVLYPTFFRYWWSPMSIDVSARCFPIDDIDDTHFALSYVDYPLTVNGNDGIT